MKAILSLRTLGLDIDGSEILLFTWYTVETLLKTFWIFSQTHTNCFILLDLPLNQQYSRKNFSEFWLFKNGSLAWANFAHLHRFLRTALPMLGSSSSYSPNCGTLRGRKHSPRRVHQHWGRFPGPGRGVLGIVHRILEIRKSAKNRGFYSNRFLLWKFWGTLHQKVVVQLSPACGATGLSKSLGQLNGSILVAAAGAV